jgi:hypothetical protein
MRHRFEIEDEIERVDYYTSVHDEYASAWEYTEARRNRAYQSCLKCFLNKSKEEMLKEKERIENEVIKPNDKFIKDWYNGSRKVFTDEYQVDNAETDNKGYKYAINYVFQESTIIKELGDDNARILKQIDTLKNNYVENCNKIREVQDWIKGS